MTEASFPTMETHYDADDGTQPICGIMRLTGSVAMNKQCLASRPDNHCGYLDQGLITFTPAASKGLVSRVEIVRPFATAVAAM